MAMDSRHYWKDSEGKSSFGGGLRLYFPKPTKTITALIVINVAIFIVQLALGKKFYLPAIFGATAADWMQVWRYFTFQFLHDTSGLTHILFNMVALYMFGGAVEKRLGVRKFLLFYLLCGAAAGAAYVIVVVTADLDRAIPIVGASGGVYALMVACAVFEPGLRFFGIFPIRPTVAVVMLLMVISVVAGLYGASSSPALSRALSDTAHLGGAITAAIWLFVSHRAAWLLRPTPSEDLPDDRRNPNPGGWQRKMQKKQQRNAEVDRILDKIHSQGIGSLTEKEKKILRDETERQRRQEMENK